MKKRIYIFSFIFIVILIGISVGIIMFKNTGNLSEVEIKDSEFNSWNKVNISLKEKALNSYYFKNKNLKNGEILLLQSKNRGLKLENGDKVNIELTMIPDGLSHTVVGYILNDNFTEIFSEPVSDKLTVSFDVKVDGEYIISVVGSNANFIRITEGTVVVK